MNRSSSRIRTGHSSSDLLLRGFLGGADHTHDEEGKYYRDQDDVYDVDWGYDNCFHDVSDLILNE